MEAVFANLAELAPAMLDLQAQPASFPKRAHAAIGGLLTTMGLVRAILDTPELSVTHVLWDSTATFRDRSCLCACLVPRALVLRVR